MNEDKINKLISLLDLVDTKANIEEFVNVFSQVVEFLKGNQEQLGAELAVVLTEIDRLTKQMADDSKEDANQIRGLVASSIMDLRSGIDRDRENLEQKVVERLATLKDGKDGAPGQTVVGKNGADGKDGSPDTPDQVVEKVNTSSVLIKKERIEGLTDLMRNIASNVAGAVGITTTFFLKNGSVIGRAKNLNIIEGNNITATMYQTGDQMNVNITSTASGSGNFATEETPTGTIDGVNAVFTLAHTPIAGSVKVFVNGSRQQTGGGDCTISGATITFNTAPDSDSILLVDYQY